MCPFSTSRSTPRRSERATVSICLARAAYCICLASHPNNDQLCSLHSCDGSLPLSSSSRRSASNAISTAQQWRRRRRSTARPSPRLAPSERARLLGVHHAASPRRAAPVLTAYAHVGLLRVSLAAHGATRLCRPVSARRTIWSHCARRLHRARSDSPPSSASCALSHHQRAPGRKTAHCYLLDARYSKDGTALAARGCLQHGCEAPGAHAGPTKSEAAEWGVESIRGDSLRPRAARQ